MVGPTWPRVRSTLGSDCLPALSQGTASPLLAFGLTDFIVTARIRCLVIGVVLVRLIDRSMFLSRLCGPEGYTYTHMSVRFHGSLYPMTDFTLRVLMRISHPPGLLMFHGGSLRFHYR